MGGQQEGKVEGREQDGRGLRWVSWLLMVLQEGLWTEEKEVGLGCQQGPLDDGGPGAKDLDFVL